MTALDGSANRYSGLGDPTTGAWGIGGVGLGELAGESAGESAGEVVPVTGIVAFTGTEVLTVSSDGAVGDQAGSVVEGGLASAGALSAPGRQSQAPVK